MGPLTIRGLPCVRFAVGRDYQADESKNDAHSSKNAADSSKNAADSSKNGADSSRNDADSSKNDAGGLVRRLHDRQDRSDESP